LLPIQFIGTQLKKLRKEIEGDYCRISRENTKGNLACAGRHRHVLLTVNTPVAIEAESNEAKTRRNKADFFSSMKSVTLEMD
jgi:hypothetical protein